VGKGKLVDEQQGLRPQRTLCLESLQNSLWSTITV
jgi:hypothetical protein